MIENGMGLKNWDRKSSKTNRTEQLTDVLDFHESRMVHGRYETLIINVYYNFIIFFHLRCVRV